MNNTFEFVGKIVPCKETENFKPYSNIVFDSGWAKKQIKFNMVCGSNRHLVESASLYDSKNTNNMKIYTFSKAVTTDSGEKAKGEKMEVNFADRFNSDIIDKVAEFKKFVIDTETPKRRYSLEKAIEKFKDGSITDEQMDNLGVHSIDECEQALVNSRKKRHEFISEYDFVDCIKSLVNSDKIKDMLFKVSGDYALEYNEKNDTWYRKFMVNRIYRAADDEETKSTATFGITFGREAVDDENFDISKKIHINGYLSTYVNMYKKNCFCPATFTIDGNGDEKAEKKALAFKKKFLFPDSCDCDYREIGVVCNILDGAQKVEITEDMLTDEQRENLEFGLITMEDIYKELGKDVYGERVTDIIINTLARGYSGGAKDTAYTSDDFKKPSILSDDEDDIFDEDII